MRQPPPRQRTRPQPTPGAPRLIRFLKQNPTIDISVTGRIGHFEFDGSNIDAAIHYGSEAWPGSLSELIMDEVLVPMCSPALIRTTR